MSSADELLTAAAMMRVLPGPAAEPIACLLDTLGMNLHDEGAAFHDEALAAARAINAGTQRRPAATAVDEDACLAHIKGACDGTTRDCAFITGAGRIKVLRTLVDRAARGVLTDHEATTLRQRTEQIIADREMWKAKAEETERERDQSDEAARRALEQRQEMAEERYALQQRADRVGHERDVIEKDLETANRLRTEAQATLLRVRALADRWGNALAPDAPYSRVLRAALGGPSPAATEATEHEKTTRVIELYERWVKAGPPPLGVSITRWWDARLAELHNAIRPPTDQTTEE